MQTTELIAKLQKLVDDHKSYEDVMGPHEIVIDVFRRSEGMNSIYRYGGFSPDVKIQKSKDGVYDILCAFAEE